MHGNLGPLSELEGTIELVFSGVLLDFGGAAAGTTTEQGVTITVSLNKRKSE